MRAPLPSPVAITSTTSSYPEEAPFHPGVRYPEYPSSAPVSPKPNGVYEAVREALHLLGSDHNNFGKPEWNPLGHIIKPGQKVFIKPNFVSHEYRPSCGKDGDLFSIITHPAILRAVADYAAIALKGNGEITIGDNPTIDTDFYELLSKTSLETLVPVYEHFGVECCILDLRPMRTVDLKDYGFHSRTTPQKGDPQGSSILNLGEESLFYKMNPLLFRGIFNKRRETIRHHHGKTHEYSISNSILNADVYISVPKLKTHKKVGATLNIKGLVGINSNKNFLIHWRIGFPANGGDEFPTPKKWWDYPIVAIRHALITILSDDAYAWLKTKLRNSPLDIFVHDIRLSSGNHYRGAWEGNDTTWRMAADLYKLFILDKTGQLPKKQRFFSVIDGIVSGEGDGPFCPDARNTGVIITGEDLLLVDSVAVRLMDFDIEKVNYLHYLLKLENKDVTLCPIKSRDFPENDFFAKEHRYLGFKQPSGWEHLSLH